MTTEIQYYIIIGTIGMSVMAIFMVMFIVIYQKKQLRQKMMLKDLEDVYQKELLKASLRGQEAERRRLADGLHDDIGTLLSATRLNLAQAMRQIDKASSQHQLMTQSKDLLDEAIENVRSLTRELKPSTLDNFGLVAALDELSQKMDSPELAISFSFNGDSLRYERNTEISVFRIAKELIHNAIKHAQATRIETILTTQANRLLLIVRDNGLGFDYEYSKKVEEGGFGLKNIESRLNSMNAKIIFDVAKGRGSEVLMEVSL